MKLLYSKHKSLTFFATKSSAESIECTPLTFEGIDNIHSCHSLPFRVLRVGHCISDDILQKYLQDSSSFLVDQPGDSFHASSPGQSPDRRFGDPLDVVPEHFSVAFRAALSQAFTAFSSTGHVCALVVGWSMARRGMRAFYL